MYYHSLHTQIRILEYKTVPVIRYRMAYAASHLVERWKLVLGNVSVINELIAEVTYHSGKEISVLQNAPIGTM